MEEPASAPEPAPKANYRDIVTVQVARGAERAQDLMDKGWVLIGEAAYMDNGDGSGSFGFPLGWPESAGPTPAIWRF